MANGVPEYKQQVSSRPLGAPTISLDTRGAFGGDLVPAVNAAANLYSAYDREKQKFGDTRVNASAVELATWEQQNVHDETNPESSKAKKGANYTPEETDKKLNEFEKTAQKIRSGLADEYQRSEFDKVYQKRRLALETWFNGYEAEQHNQVSKEQFESRLAASIVDGKNYATNEKMRNTSLLEGLETVKKRGQAEGWSEERVADESKNFTTRFHSLVAVGLKTAKSANDALEYIVAHEDRINPEVFEKLKDKYDGPAIMEDGRNEASAIQAVVGSKNWAAQLTELENRRAAGVVDNETYNEARNWIDKDRHSFEQAKIAKDNSDWSALELTIRERFARKEPEILNTHEDAYKNASPEVRARALNLMNILLQSVGQGTPSTASARASQNATYSQFMALPVEAKAAFADKKHFDNTYGGFVTVDQRTTMLASAAGADKIVKAGEVIPFTEFSKQAAVHAQDMFPGDEDARNDFKDGMETWYFSFKGEKPRAKEIDAEFGRRFLLYTRPFGVKSVVPFTGPNEIYGFQLDPKDRSEYNVAPVEEQKFVFSKELAASELSKGKAVPAASSARPKVVTVPPEYVVITDGTHTRKVKKSDLSKTLAAFKGWREVK